MDSTRETESLSNLDPVILDITGDSKGAVSALGEHLVFRLHQGGCVEYDSPHPEKREFVRHEYKISPEEIQELMQLVENPEFLGLAEHYSPLPGLKECYAVTDIAIEYKKQSSKKRITISDYEPGHPEAESLYPVRLRDMLQKVFQIHIRNR